MTRIAKEVNANNVRYIYQVENKNRVSYLIYNRARIFKNSTAAFGGWDMERKCYCVTVQYAR